MPVLLTRRVPRHAPPHPPPTLPQSLAALRALASKHATEAEADTRKSGEYREVRPPPSAYRFCFRMLPTLHFPASIIAIV